MIRKQTIFDFDNQTIGFIPSACSKNKPLIIPTEVSITENNSSIERYDSKVASEQNVTNEKLDENIEESDNSEDKVLPISKDTLFMLWIAVGIVGFGLAIIIVGLLILFCIKRDRTNKKSKIAMKHIEMQTVKAIET